MGNMTLHHPLPTAAPPGSCGDRILHNLHTDKPHRKDKPLCKTKSTGVGPSVATPKEAGSWGLTSPTQQHSNWDSASAAFPPQGDIHPSCFTDGYTGWAVNVAEWQHACLPGTDLTET